MANPKYKTPKSKTRRRRSHLKLTVPKLVVCSNKDCKEMRLPHRVCPACGTYHGRNYSSLLKIQS
ncbi:MAG TPA: 50S ribosomal protein L32 [Candidatus Eremiobacteraeota bacterium]|nr:MAG: 50S ribosomal protein L32 [bacterium ADurb.Bin363]HPZ10075.1 50S ribosomal protein L32 [Candidatus Eremiobacteraeota bacterium]